MTSAISCCIFPERFGGRTKRGEVRKKGAGMRSAISEISVLLLLDAFDSMHSRETTWTHTSLLASLCTYAAVLHLCATRCTKSAALASWNGISRTRERKVTCGGLTGQQLEGYE